MKSKQGEGGVMTNLRCTTFENRTVGALLGLRIGYALGAAKAAGPDRETLANAMTCSLIEARGYDKDCVARHLAETGLRPDAMGNDLAVQCIPMAVMDALMCRRGRRTLAELIMFHGRIMHADSRAMFAAFALAYMVQVAFGHTVDGSRTHSAYRVLEDLRNLLMEFESREICPLPTISSRIGHILAHQLLADPDRLRMHPDKGGIGTGRDCWQSVVFAIATYLRHPMDYCSGVREAMDAGGDAAANAAMVGALIGAQTGVDGIPVEWTMSNPDYRRTVELAVAFSRSFSL